MSVATIELERELLDMLHQIHGRLGDKVTEYLVLELYRQRPGGRIAGHATPEVHPLRLALRHPPSGPR